MIDEKIYSMFSLGSLLLGLTSYATANEAGQAVVRVPQSVLDQYTPEQRAEAERIAQQYGIPFVVVKDRHHTPHRKEK